MRGKMKKILTILALVLLVLALTLTMVACDEQGPQGEQGIQGPQGLQGIQGIPGEKGEDGHSPVITIGTNGNWFIDGVDTGVSAQGATGTTGPQGPKGNEGQPGKDGSTWHCGAQLISANANGLKNGDYFFNTTTLDVYCLVLGSWEKIANMSSTIEPEMVTVNFEVNLPAYMYEFEERIASSTLIQTQTIEKGSWLTMENFDIDGDTSNLSDYFLGWYVGEGVDETKITSYTSINADCTLMAKWDYDKISEKYTSAGVVLSKDSTERGYSAWIEPCCGEVVHVGETFNGQPVIRVSGINLAGKNIRELSLPYSANTDGGVTIDPDYATSLEKVSWRNKVGSMEAQPASYIGIRSFEYCSSLKEINIPDSIISIENLAFRNCTSLKAFDCRYVEKINDNAFYNCTSLENLTMWNVEEIGECAFYNCSNLKYSHEALNLSFYIPESVKVIENNAFEGCVSLTEIYIDSTEVANLTNNDSYLFSCVKVINIKKSIVTDATSYLDDSQGNFVRTITDKNSSHDELRKVE